MTPRLRQALVAARDYYKNSELDAVLIEIFTAYEAEPEPSLPDSDNFAKPATTPEPRFRVGDKVRATDPCNVGELGTVVGWRVRWDCDCNATIALGDLEPMPPDAEPDPDYRLDRIEERLKKLEER